MVLVMLTGQQAWEWVWLLPWVTWLWKGLGVAWPRQGGQAWYQGLGRVWEEASRVALVGLGLLWLGQQIRGVGERGVTGVAVGGVVLRDEGGESSVEVEQDEAGVYHVRLKGEFELHVDGQVEMYKRMMFIFVGQLEVPGESRGSRRTRDGRTPHVRQEELASWAGVPQPNISRWFKYWLEQDWRRMLSQKKGEVLTLEMQQRVVDVWAKFPWWGAEKVWKHLKAQGEHITLEQVRQVARESGWSVLRKALGDIYAISVESFRPRDEWLVKQLLAQVERLVEQLEALGGLTPEEQIERADLEALSKELGIQSFSVRRALPWAMQLERQLFGCWEQVEDGTVHCIYCGTRKGSYER
jgi:hypothetical protein